MAKKENTVQDELNTEKTAEGTGECIGEATSPEGATTLEEQKEDVIPEQNTDDELPVIHSLRQELIKMSEVVISQGTKIAELTEELKTANENFETAKKQSEDFSAEIDRLNEKIKSGGQDNTEFIQFLDDLDEGLQHYAGRRTERLRREFVTDFKDMIEATKEGLTTTNVD